MRNTQAVRNIIKENCAARFGLIYTNLYKNCRTVKFYDTNTGNTQRVIRDLENSGIDHTVKIGRGMGWANRRSVIIRVPRTY